MNITQASNSTQSILREEQKGKRAQRVTPPRAVKPQPGGLSRSARLDKHAAKMRRRTGGRRLLPNITPTPYSLGQRFGRAGRSYLPWLQYSTGGEWCEFYRGWLAGKREGAK